VIAVSRPTRPGAGDHFLIDRKTGRREPINTGHDLTWDLLSVSPWRDKNGNLQALGRWISRPDEIDGDAFCGLGLLKLPGATVIKRIATDVLPTGRACWVPGHPGEFLFPAGDGLLYRCTVAGAGDGELDGEAGDEKSASGSERGAAVVRPVVWDYPSPGCGRTFLFHPVWSSDSRLRHVVFVGLSVQKRIRKRNPLEPAKLWWLEMNEEGDTIRRAGPLRPSSSRPNELNMTAECFPNVVVGPDGVLSIVYLTRRHDSRTAELRWSRLELDPNTGVPSSPDSADRTRILATELALAPVVVSADGRRILALKGSCELIEVELPSPMAGN
jgi:hypothetical protein